MLAQVAPLRVLPAAQAFWAGAIAAANGNQTPAASAAAVHVAAPAIANVQQVHLQVTDAGTVVTAVPASTTAQQPAANALPMSTTVPDASTAGNDNGLAGAVASLSATAAADEWQRCIQQAQTAALAGRRAPPAGRGRNPA